MGFGHHSYLSQGHLKAEVSGIMFLVIHDSTAQLL